MSSTRRPTSAMPSKATGRLYNAQHGAPELLDKFICAVPEHFATWTLRTSATPAASRRHHIAATVPLIQSGLTEPEVFVSGVTGSTGSGRSPQAGTHHPERNSNLYAYKPLAHRHAPEIAALAKRPAVARPACTSCLTQARSHAAFT